VSETDMADVIGAEDGGPLSNAAVVELIDKRDAAGGSTVPGGTSEEDGFSARPRRKRSRNANTLTVLRCAPKQSVVAAARGTCPVPGEAAVLAEAAAATGMSVGVAAATGRSVG